MAPRTACAYSPGRKPSRTKYALLFLSAALFALVTTGCQTSKGFGKDVENLGDKIQDKAS
jgi:predicted small secreted protein